MIVSVPSFINKKSGSRLTKNASFTAVLTCKGAHWVPLSLGVRVVSIGHASSVRVIIKAEDIVIGVECIAATWSCTKSFWFLKPADGCYPLGACE